MKIHKIEIHNIRGVRDLIIEPEGNSFVVYGPNGSGKSAIVDAIEFLFTGKISRLMGRGTIGITLPRYGPHIDMIDQPEESWVKAMVKIPDIPDLIEIKRTMENPSVFVCDTQYKSRLDKIMEVASRGQHILSRREILKYVTAEKGVRGKEIQNLLKLNDVENIRRNLVKIFNEYDRIVKSDKEHARRETQKVCEAVGIENYDKVEVLNFANERRKLLDGNMISNLSIDSLQEGLTPPSESDEETINTTEVEQSIKTLLGLVTGETKLSFDKSVSILNPILEQLSSDRDLVDSLQREKFFSLGLENIDDSGKCPLCEYEWPNGQIRIIIEKKLETVNIALGLKKQIDIHQITITDILVKHKFHSTRIIENLQLASMTPEMQQIQEWNTKVTKLLESYDSSIEQYSKPLYSIKEVQDILSPSNIEQNLVTILSEVVKRFPLKSNPRLKAWDELTVLITQFKDMNRSVEQYSNSMKKLQRAEVLKDSFVTARDTILGSLLTSVRDRFVELYCQIHSEDEAGFKAKLELEDATCDLQVDFYGRNLHPPHALHSEGHQDCMGLCLYLAIIENLSEEVIDLVVLDDVVMSIDTAHRRGICDIINDVFSDKQFMITTHDKTWAYQLKNLLHLDKKRFRQFSNWSIDFGPETEFEEPIWATIYELIDKDEISDAAGRLRRWLEQFLGTVCNDLRASTRHRLDGRHELWDLLNGAQSRYGRLLKKAKNAANSWNDTLAVDEITKIESIKDQINSRIGEEYWSVNAAVHYTKWNSFSQADFRPVIQAFDDLCNLFVCQKCMTNLQVTLVGNIEKTVTCSCTETTWNLERKE